MARFNQSAPTVRGPPKVGSSHRSRSGLPKLRRTLSTPDDNSLKVAIIGAGPAGFYAAARLLAEREDVEVHMFERLPVPFGLVRFGVAPDHPKIKSVTRVYEKTAAHERFRFYGNVEIGRDITHEDLMARHHAVIYSTGAAVDRRLGIPGEDLAGSHPATEFVAWYNGHPDAANLEYDLSTPRAVVIGNGNVAVDVARMLGLSREELAETERRITRSTCSPTRRSRRS